MLCVSDINAAHQHLVDAGIEVSDIDIQPWGHFVYFDDPDGNHFAPFWMNPDGPPTG